MASTKKRMIWTALALTLIIVVAVVLCFFAAQWMDSSDSAAKNSSTLRNTAAAAFTPATDEIVDEVIAQMNYKDLSKTAKDQISKHYVIPDGLVMDASVYLAQSPDSAVEISCFKIADPNYQPQLDKVVADHITTKLAGFKDSPKEYNLLQKYTLAHNGQYTLVVVEENGAAAANVFKAYLEASTAE